MHFIDLEILIVSLLQLANLPILLRVRVEDLGEDEVHCEEGPNRYDERVINVGTEWIIGRIMLVEHDVRPTLQRANLENRQ